MTQAQNIAELSSDVNSSGILQVVGGGTGQASLTAENVILGNGANAVKVVAPGTANNVLTSNGTTWVSQAPIGVTSITGTANQIIASASTGAVTLSAPQSIGTASNVQFGSIGVGAAASGTAGRINATTGVFTPGTTGVSTGLTVVNGDLTSYRSGGTTGVIYLSSSGSHYLFWDGTNYNLNAGNLICTGNITAFSDEKLKKNWRHLSPKFVYELAQVKSGVYDRIDQEITQVGVSAQSLQKIMPEAVLESNDGTLSVSYGSAALAACVELAKEVVKLREELEALKYPNTGD